MLLRLLAAAAAGTALLATSLLTWLQTGLGIVAAMASLAIVLACISLVISGRTARRIRAMNLPAEAITQDG